MSLKFDFCVVSAGIVGAATAYALSRRYPTADIAILDKECDVAQHQSGHNSGVVHAGVYYAPGSHKALLCRAGLEHTYAFCRANDVPVKQTGKLVVATEQAELGRLESLSARAQQNGTRCRLIDQAELRVLEPNIAGLAALEVCETGIVDYIAMTQAMLDSGGDRIQRHFNSEVKAIGESERAVSLSTEREQLDCAQLIVCAGLQSDRLARMAGLESDCVIVPFRGDYYRLTERPAPLISRLIYPVPDPALPFLGVHITRMIDGSVTIGPNAMLALAREQYRKFAFDWRDSGALIGHLGFWRLLARYPGAGLREMQVATSRRRYLAEVRRYCPRLEIDDIDEHLCGIRAQAVNHAGELLHDFVFAQSKRSLHVLNAPSPAATASLPIGELIVDKLAG